MTGTSVKVAVSGDRVLVIPTADGVYETAQAHEHSMPHGRDMSRDCHEIWVVVGHQRQKEKITCRCLSWPFPASKELSVERRTACHRQGPARWMECLQRQYHFSKLWYEAQRRGGYRMAQDLVTANEALAKELLRQKTDQKTVIRTLPVFGYSVRERLCTMQERARFEQDLQTLTNDLSTKAEEEVITARDL